MKLVPKLTTAAIAILITNCSLALSSTIPIKGGTVLPGTSMLLSTDKLYDDVKYTLTCTIKNNNPNAAEKSDFSLYSPSGNASIDSKYIDNGTAHVSHFYSKGSVLKITPIQKSTGNIVIRNLDYNDTISVNDCNALLIG